MKIGVLTYHKERSHGATFQAYATYRALQELGCDVEVIDLAHEKHVTSAWLRKIALLYFCLSDYRQNKFRIKYYPPFSNHYNNYNELCTSPPEVDALCVGSDQTWNLNIATEENMMAFFLAFGGINMPRFSYASSFGYPEWQIKDAEQTEHIGDLLKSYIGLSVREITAQRILNEKFGLNAQLVCDPTLLHTNYEEFTGNLAPRDEVICYSLYDTPEPMRSASKEIGKFVGSPVRWLGTPYYVKGVRNTYLPDFYRWFRYMAASKYILTNSFHGTVLALISKKPFAVLYKENGLSSRIVDLLKQVGLEERIFFSYHDFISSESWKKEIDYSEVDNKLSIYREKSWDYLKDVVKKINMSL